MRAILAGGGRVDFEHAKEIGDEGEQRVAVELERPAPKYGMTVLRTADPLLGGPMEGGD